MAQNEVIEFSIDQSQILKNIEPKDKNDNPTILVNPEIQCSNPNLVDAAFQGNQLRLNHGLDPGVGTVIVTILEGFEGGYSESWTVNVVPGKVADLVLTDPV